MNLIYNLHGLATDIVRAMVSTSICISDGARYERIVAIVRSHNQLPVSK